MDGIRIREATPEDVEVLATLMTDLGYPTSTGEMVLRLKRISSDPSRVTLVAEHAETVVGMAGMGIEHAYEANDSYARITALVTTPKHRGRGIGRFLVKASEAWAAGRGATDIMLSTSKRRTASTAAWATKTPATASTSRYSQKATIFPDEPGLDRRVATVVGMI